MATIPASLEAQLDADWTGAGGAEPAYYSTEVFTYSNPPPMGKDFVWIVEKSLKTLSPRFNDLYANKTHTIDIIVNSGTTAARLKELSDEVERILNATAITGVHIQHIEARDLITPETTKNHLERVEVQMKTLLSDSSTAYGSGASGYFLDEDDMASDSDTSVASQQSIKAYTDNSITTHDGAADAHHTKYTDADAIAAVVAENPLSLTHGLEVPEELDMTGVAATIDMNPAHTAGGNMIDITPTANQASGTWKGLNINGVSLDPSGATTIYGTHIDISGVSLANNPALTGLYIQMPNTYGGGNEYGIFVIGDGRQVRICTDTQALECYGGVYQEGGSWYSANTTSTSYFLLDNARNDANPYFQIGAGGSNYFQMKAYYNAGTTVLDYFLIKTLTASGTATDGNIRFQPDGTEVFRLNTAADTNQAKVTGNLEVTGTITDATDSMTVAQMADLMMFGSTNAAWVPVAFDGWTGQHPDVAAVGHRSFDGTNPTWQFVLGLPTTKGTLKLYINGVRLVVSDADGAAYIDQVRVMGMTDGGFTAVYTDGTNTDSAAVWESGSGLGAWGAADDMSSYGAARVFLNIICDALGELDITSVQLSCYYAT